MCSLLWPLTAFCWCVQLAEHTKSWYRSIAYHNTKRSWSFTLPREDSKTDMITLIYLVLSSVFSCLIPGWKFFVLYVCPLVKWRPAFVSLLLYRNSPRTTQSLDDEELETFCLIVFTKCSIDCQSLMPWTKRYFLQPVTARLPFDNRGDALLGFSE